MRILPTLLCALGTVSALDINAFMAKLKADSDRPELKEKNRSAKKSDRRNSAPADIASIRSPEQDQSKSAKKLARKQNRSTQPPATTRTQPTTTRPQPTTTRRVPPTRRVVGKRPVGKRPAYRPAYRRPTGRPIAAGKATRRPTVRGRFRPTTRGTTQVSAENSENKTSEQNLSTIVPSEIRPDIGNVPTVRSLNRVNGISDYRIPNGFRQSRMRAEIRPNGHIRVQPDHGSMTWSPEEGIIELKKKPPRPRVTTPKPVVSTPSPEILAPEVLARRHFKAPSVLSAGGRLFGYRSLTNDIVEKEPVAKTPFPTGDFEIAVQDSQVFSARQWTFGSGRSNLATSCWTCQGRSYADCLNNGSAQTCGADQSACFVREYTQSSSNIIVYMGCQNMFQCVKDFNNNSPNVADSRGTQPDVVGYEKYGQYSTAASCVPGQAGSVCHQCCAGSNNCNSSWATTAMSTINEWTARSHTQNQT